MLRLPFVLLLVFVLSLFEGGIGKLADINDSLMYKAHMSYTAMTAKRCMHSLSVAIVHILAAATIRGWRLFCSELPIVRLLFEGSNCLRAASIRRLSGNTTFALRSTSPSTTIAHVLV